MKDQPLSFSEHVMSGTFLVYANQGPSESYITSKLVFRDKPSSVSTSTSKEAYVWRRIKLLCSLMVTINFFTSKLINYSRLSKPFGKVRSLIAKFLITGSKPQSGYTEIFGSESYVSLSPSRYVIEICCWEKLASEKMHSSTYEMT